MSSIFDRAFLDPLSARFGPILGDQGTQALRDEFSELGESDLDRALVALILKSDMPLDFFQCFSALDREARRPTDGSASSYFGRAKMFPTTVVRRGTREWDDWQEYFETKGLRFLQSEMQRRDSWTVPDCRVEEFEAHWRKSEGPAGLGVRTLAMAS